MGILWPPTKTIDKTHTFQNKISQHCWSRHPGQGGCRQNVGEGQEFLKSPKGADLNVRETKIAGHRQLTTT